MFSTKTICAPLAIPTFSVSGITRFFVALAFVLNCGSLAAAEPNGTNSTQSQQAQTAPSNQQQAAAQTQQQRNPHGNISSANPHAGMFPGRPNTNIQKARNALGTENFEEALGFLHLALSSELKDFDQSTRQLNECWLMLAYAYQQSNNLERADEYYTNVTDSDFFKNYKEEDKFKETVLSLKAQVRAQLVKP